MPPKHAGLSALLDGRALDVVVCVHTGLEAVRELGDLVNGRLLGRTVRVALWRVPAADVPPGRKQRRDWLEAQWAQVDAWVALNQGRA